MSLDITQFNSAFVGHQDFCQWLVRTMRPKITVELGTDEGYSFFNFAIPGIGSVFGVDDWTHPFHQGSGGPKRERIATNLLPNMHILDGSFTTVAKAWSINRETIDLLLVDGSHDFNSVKEDFENWSPFLTSGSVVLFHDTRSFPNDVGRFFNSLEGARFEFPHAHGLGVWTKP